MWLVLNLVWLSVSLGLVVMVRWGVRRGEVLIAPIGAVTLILLISFLFLPAISVSDNLLEARQAALSISAQTRHTSFQGAAARLEVVSVIGACLLALYFGVKEQVVGESERGGRPREALFTLFRRLRPPPDPLS